MGFISGPTSSALCDLCGLCLRSLLGRPRLASSHLPARAPCLHFIDAGPTCQSLCSFSPPPRTHLPSTTDLWAATLFFSHPSSDRSQTKSRPGLGTHGSHAYLLARTFLTAGKPLPLCIRRSPSVPLFRALRQSCQGRNANGVRCAEKETRWRGCCSASALIFQWPG